MIDDLERHSATLPVRDILGVITQLKEERGCQIIIVSGLERDEERRRIASTTEILTDLTGRKPAGWFSLPRQRDH